jgi:hypothetical protein
VVSVTAAPVLTALTASQAVFTNASKALVSNAITGTGNVVMSTSATLVTPALGTPSALVGTNITGTAAGLTAGNVTTNANLTGAVTSVGNATSLGSFTSAQLATALTDETGTGSAVFATSPTLVTPALGTPSALVGTNITGTAAGLTAGNVTTNANLTGAVTSVGNATSLGSFTSAQLATALTDETGTGSAVFATSPTLVTPNLGTPSTLVGTNITGTAAGLTAGNVSTNANLTGAVTSVGNATSLGSFTSAQLATALTDETGTGSAVFATSPTLVTPALGTPSSGTVTNLTGTASININGTVGATTPAAGAFTTIAASGTTTLSGNQIISVTDNTNAALRITQLGTGNALLVEDSANPDASPFVIDANGRVVIGNTAVVSPVSGVTPSFQMQGATSGASSMGVIKFGNDSAQPYYIFSKTRSATLGTFGTIVQSGDNIGTILFTGDDGSATPIQGARIDALVDGTPGLNDMPGRLTFSTTADGASTPTERMRISNAGSVGIGGTPSAGQVLYLGKNITGSVNSTSVRQQGVVQSDVTASVLSFDNVLLTAAAAFTLTNYTHFNAQQSTIGASSAVTLQIGFNAASTLTGATNNYGFRGSIASGTNRYNLYMDGTADNYFAGSVGIGAVPTSAAKTNITSTSAGASAIALSLINSSTTIGTETVLDLVATTTGAGVRSAQITAINTDGSTGVNMVFKISNGAVPAEAMRIGATGLVTVTGTLKVSTGAAVGGATPGTGGVAFPATAVAVSDANTLDDYEEGSWTPVVTFSGGNGDLTTAEANGVYTKIGRLVQIAFNVEFTETTASGNMTLTGVPFTSGPTVRTNVGCWVDNMINLVGSPTAGVGLSATAVQLQQTVTGAIANITNANTGVSSRVRGSLSYSI